MFTKAIRQWRGIKVGGGKTYKWNSSSTYVQHPPYFEGMTMEPAPVADVKGANILALLGEAITTDHISPAGAIAMDGPAGAYLSERQVPRNEFNSFGSRRGNHQVMMRGTFANIRIKNEMCPGTSGGLSKYKGETMSIYDAAMKHKADGNDLVVLAGGLYGNGSSRDWAAKGTILLGVKAVIAESFERIHRSNLLGMGVLPLEFTDGQGWKTLGLDGTETVDIEGISGIKPRGTIGVTITDTNGKSQSITARIRIDTENELEYYRHGGILHYVLRNLAAKQQAK